MKQLLWTASAALNLIQGVTSTPLATHSKVVVFKPIVVTTDSVHNIHVDYIDDDFEGDIHLIYGTCNLEAIHQSHHEIGSTILKRSARPERFVWVVPDDAFHGGCVSAFSGNSLIGRSAPVAVKRNLRKREDIAAIADASGPWFDGVAYLKSKQNNATFVAQAKSKKIGIVGGGMSGLLTSLLLDSVGIHDWHITESSQRVGGRIRTKYLANTTYNDYQYQEMGPMRFPVSVRYVAAIDYQRFGSLLTLQVP